MHLPIVRVPFALLQTMDKPGSAQNILLNATRHPGAVSTRKTRLQFDRTEC